jgi:hypothetical protein
LIGLLKYIIEGTIQDTEVMVRQGRRHKKLLGDLKEMKGYWKLKEEPPDCT